MKNIGFWVGHVKCHVFAFPEASLTGSLSGMAVGTKNLALLDLHEDGRPCESSCAHIRDSVPFVAEMVELQDDRVSFAALNARMLREVLPHSELVLVSGLVPGLADVRDICLSRLRSYQARLYSTKQPLAPRVTDAELRVPEAEFIEWFLDAAPSADLRFRLH
jgi:hypothetical protein